MQVKLMAVRSKGGQVNVAWSIVTDDGKVYPFGGNDEDSREVAQRVLDHHLAGKDNIAEYNTWEDAFPYDQKERLSQLLRDAEKAHAEYEKTQLNGIRDANWADWYADYILSHQGVTR